MEQKTEVWLRGPVKDIAALLQPIAAALLQVGEEAHTILEGFPEELLWEKPEGVAAPAFHLKHIPGVIDRLFTYARKESLSKEQMNQLVWETKKEENAPGISKLLDNLDKQIESAIKELKTVDENSLTEPRSVGRKQIPSTLIGLYSHSAEHSMRHIGQLLVTVKILRGKKEKDP